MRPDDAASSSWTMPWSSCPPPTRWAKCEGRSRSACRVGILAAVRADAVLGEFGGAGRRGEIADRGEVARQCLDVGLVDAAGVVLGQLGQIATVGAKGVRGLPGKGQVGEEVATVGGQVVLAG